MRIIIQSGKIENDVIPSIPHPPQSHILPVIYSFRALFIDEIKMLYLRYTNCISGFVTCQWEVFFFNSLNVAS